MFEYFCDFFFNMVELLLCSRFNVDADEGLGVAFADVKPVIRVDNGGAVEVGNVLRVFCEGAFDFL